MAAGPRRYLLSVDPGGVHVGCCQFDLGTKTCVLATEFTPETFRPWLWARLAIPNVEVIVVENFRLVYGKAMQQVGSTFGEVRLIGAIEALVELANVGHDEHDEPTTSLVMQEPQLRLAAEHQAKARGYTFQSRGSGGHAKSAELHGLAWLWRHDT